ncbi:MAG: hypothetical protein WCJ66_16000 [Verrucomicrobiota bacterium]
MQNNALIARSAYQTDRRWNCEPDLKGSRQEEKLENQSAFHGRSLLNCSEYTTRDETNAKGNIDELASRAILTVQPITHVEPETECCTAD